MVGGGAGVEIDIQRACHNVTRTLVSLTQIYLLYKRISDHRFIETVLLVRQFLSSRVIAF